MPGLCPRRDAGSREIRTIRNYLSVSLSLSLSLAAGERNVTILPLKYTLDAEKVTLSGPSRLRGNKCMRDAPRVESDIGGAYSGQGALARGDPARVCAHTRMHVRIKRLRA